jgi:elongation factor 2
MSANFKVGQKDELHKNFARILVKFRNKYRPISDVPCGNMIVLSGIDGFLQKSGTISSINHPEAYPIRSMKFSLFPVLKVYVEPKDPKDLPHLMLAFRKLGKINPLVSSIYEETCETIVAGCG